MLLWLAGVLAALPLAALGHCDAQYGFELTTALTWVTNPVATVVSSPSYYTDEVFAVPVECGSSLQAQATFAASSGLLVNSDPQYMFAFFGIGSFDGWDFQLWVTDTKLYAYYARGPVAQTPLDHYVAFAYLIPLADLGASEFNDYAIVLDAASRAVSYRLNDYELLRIRHPGAANVDSKFLISDLGGYNESEGFPAEVFLVLGLGSQNRLLFTGAPHTACQGTIFDDCLDKLGNAQRTECVYVPYNTTSTPVPGSLAIESIGVTVVRPVNTCPEWTCDLRNMGCGDSSRVDFCQAPAPVCLPCVPEQPVGPQRFAWQVPRIEPLKRGH